MYSIFGSCGWPCGRGVIAKLFPVTAIGTSLDSAMYGVCRRSEPRVTFGGRACGSFTLGRSLCREMELPEALSTENPSHAQTIYQVNFRSRSDMMLAVPVMSAVLTCTASAAAAGGYLRACGDFREGPAAEQRRA